MKENNKNDYEYTTHKQIWKLLNNFEKIQLLILSILAFIAIFM